MLRLSQSFKEQVKCRWREFRREPSAFFWVIFMPILWMIALGFAFSDPKPEVYSIGWYSSADNQEEHKKVLGLIENDPQLKVNTGSKEKLNPLLKMGEISLVFSIEDDVLQFKLDPINPVATRAKAYVDRILQAGYGRENVLTVTTEVIKAKGSRYVDFLIPGLLGLSIMSTSLFGVGMTIVSNRKENLLKRYVASPMPPYEYVVSHIVGRVITLATEFAAIFIAGWIIFDFHVYGNFISYCLFAILGAAAFTGIGILCGSRTRSIPFISGITNLIMIPMTMVCGVFFSYAAFPEWMKAWIKFLPLTALNDGLRKIALEGQSIFQLQFEISVLVVFTVVTAIAATKAFKWY